VAIAAWFVLSIFVQEVKPGVRRATEGTLIDTATLLAEIGRDDLLSGMRSRANWRRPFHSFISAFPRQYRRHS
jgi:two-component system sensor histidine kinase CreC